jgi:hypothetical protein
MSSSAAPRCQHIKVSGTQCGSPALRKNSFCFYHQQNRPLTVECYSGEQYATGEIVLPVFEDAHSIQTVIRQVVQMILQKRIERKTASLLLYALQIASSNLKRMELETPQPAEVVTDLETMNLETIDLETGQTPVEPTNHDEEANEVSASRQTSQNANQNEKLGGEGLPSGAITIQACYRPGQETRSRQSHQRKKQYVI